MSLSVYIRQAVENGKIIFPGDPKTYGFCQKCSEHQNEEKYKCLQCLRAAKSAHSFSSQYMNDPIDEESIEFKTDWIQKIEMDDYRAGQLQGLPGILSIDPAVGLNSYNDYSGLVVTKPDVKKATVYVLEALQLRLSPEKLINKVFDLVKTYNIVKVLLETTALQRVYLLPFKQEMIKRKTFFTIEEVGRSTKESKAMRIRGLIPYYANGRVFHRRGLDDLEYQMIQFPRNSHDDILDALAYQVSYWKSMPTSAAPRDSAPYWSMNWWKKQTPQTGHEGFDDIFSDLREK